MVRNLEYPKRARNTVKRYDSRGTNSHKQYVAWTDRPGTYDCEAIHKVINTTPVLHVSFPPGADDPFPALLPMIGVMGSFDYPSADLNEPLDCYLHGYVSARLMRLARDSEKGLPVTIAATKVDGLVLSLTPNSHSMNYRSAVLQGYARPVEKVEEKLWAMEKITNKVIPQRWENTRVPPDGAEMSSTMILRVTVETGSGKIRQGEPHDEAKDQKRSEITSTVWTGVVPLYETLGTPIPSKDNQVNELPAYINSYVEQRTKESRERAVQAAQEP